MTTKHPLLDFLKANAFFIRANTYTNPFADSWAVSYIPSFLEINLIKAAGEQRAIVHQGNTRDFQTYYTTPYGLVLIINRVINDVAFYNINGYNVIYPDATMELIWKGLLPFKEGTYAAQTKFTTRAEIDEVVNLRAVNEEKSLAAKQKYEDSRVRFFAFMMNAGAPELLAERLWCFDIFYDYSDDICVYKAGSTKEKSFRTELTNYNIDANKVMGMLVEMKSVSK